MAILQGFGILEDSRINDQYRMSSRIQYHLQCSLDDLISNRFPIRERCPQLDTEMDLRIQCSILEEIACSHDLESARLTKLILDDLMNVNNGLIGCSGVSEIIVRRFKEARKEVYSRLSAHVCHLNLLRSISRRTTASLRGIIVSPWERMGG